MWKRGTTNGHNWDAKVFEVGSESGIDGGRISKLTIYAKPGTMGRDGYNKWIYNYDRGIDFDDCPPGLLEAVIAAAIR